MIDNSRDGFLNSKQVRDRYGDVSDMWLHRKLRDDAEFPKPLIINTRRYWKLSALIAWEQKCAARPVDVVRRRQARKAVADARQKRRAQPRV